MSLGFEQAGFDIVAAVDIDPVHAQLHSANFPNTRSVNADISLLTGRRIREEAGLEQGELAVVFGGPPCQGFSMIGKRHPDDPRNLLIHQFARLIRELRPLYFVLENVSGLLMGTASKTLYSFLDRVDEAGYTVAEPVGLLDACDFGVPQRRRRVFVVGSRKGLPVAKCPVPVLNQSPRDQIPTPTVWDAIGDLAIIDKHLPKLTGDSYFGPLGKPSPYAAILRDSFQDETDKKSARGKNGVKLSNCLRTAHTRSTTWRFHNTPPGTYESTSRFYRLQAHGLAPTLRAGTDSLRGSFTAPRPIHPVYARCITVREAARLHSFPDWFSFHPTVWHGFRQVGNSVPPFLARAVAREIKALL